LPIMVNMDNSALIELLIQVIKSWQVIAITIALIFYLNIVFYVSKVHHRPRAIHKLSTKKKKDKPEPEIKEDALPIDDDDEPPIHDEDE